MVAEFSIVFSRSRGDDGLRDPFWSGQPLQFEAMEGSAFFARMFFEDSLDLWLDVSTDEFSNELGTSRIGFVGPRANVSYVCKSTLPAAMRSCKTFLPNLACAPPG